MGVKPALHSIAEVDGSVTANEDGEQPYEMSRKTLGTLEDCDADDENEGITVVTEWIIDQIKATGNRPSSTAVRQCASESCRNNGYEIPDNSRIGR